MATQQKTLFEGFIYRARVVKQGDIAMIVMDGGGALIVAMDEYVTANKWAQSKMSSGNMVTDRGRFLDQFTYMVARPGSFLGTKGNDRQLYRLVKAMRAAGHGMDDWMVPTELKAAKLADPDEVKKKVKNEPGAEGEAPEGQGGAE